ncbi:MAG: hypothetical protein AB1430_21410 [Pseudomonadota bacterium]
MIRPMLFAALAAMLCAAVPASAQTTAAKKPVARSATKPTAKSSKIRKPRTPAEAQAPEVLTEGQMAAAGRVFTGRADCEFKQAVVVQPVQGQAGHFDVRFGKRSYRMVPVETTTGAVRLHDKQADVVWLQIPVKSMMMDNKAGRRLVDACQHPQQRAAVEAMEQARVAADAAGTAASAAGSAAAAATAAAAQPATAAAASAAEKAAVAASAAAAAASAAVPSADDSLLISPASAPAR